MNIDIERLKRDRAYWDEVAPEEATHFCPDTEEEWPAWWINPRNKTGRYMAKRSDITNAEWSGSSFDDHTQAHAIPRPEPATEWDGGLPPIGVECEFRYKGDEWEPRKCVPLGFSQERNEAWLHLDKNESSSVYVFDRFEFRPIRTKAERDREDLCEIASKYSDLGHVIADDILAAGWQKLD